MRRRSFIQACCAAIVAAFAPKVHAQPTPLRQRIAVGTIDGTASDHDFISAVVVHPNGTLELTYGKFVWEPR